MMCSKEQNHHFLGNWYKISVLKMEVAVFGEPTVFFVFFSVINDSKYGDETE